MSKAHEYLQSQYNSATQAEKEFITSVNTFLYTSTVIFNSPWLLVDLEVLRIMDSFMKDEFNLEELEKLVVEVGKENEQLANYFKSKKQEENNSLGDIPNIIRFRATNTVSQILHNAIKIAQEEN